MKKVRANASWNKLTVMQQETLDNWLFEEKLSYAVILPRAQKELGFKGSRASLHRYYVRRDKERTLTKFCTAREQVAAVSGAPVDEKELRKASMKLLGEFLFQQIRQSPDKVKEWGMVASLIVDNDRNELLRELKGEELKMRQQAMDFAREKFQFDMMEKALRALPQLNELAEAKKDPHTKRYEENAYWNGVRHAMFGKGIDIHPESAQEEAEMVAIKREREARLAAEAQQLRDREVIINAEPPPPSSPHHKEYMAVQAQWEAEALESEKALDESPVKASAAGKAEQAEREKLLRELREAQAEEEADEQERERALREYQAQAAEISDVEQAKRKKLQEQQEAERAERKKQREQREARARARLEELREVCGWQEVQRPPGMEGEG
jgi:hypothetical protein